MTEERRLHKAMAKKFSLKPLQTMEAGFELGMCPSGNGCGDSGSLEVKDCVD
jgi:hypothetical protein